MQHPQARFIGKRPYGELAAYARAFDVAVLPYRRCEPTYSGSSTRFYEHLAACRPMIATRGFEELLRKTPLLELIDTAEEAAEALQRLRACEFNDGFAALRWQASQQGTWQVRARSMTEALEAKLGLGLAGRTAADHLPAEAAAAR
jgi:glycosyltransferase involved in cell wall biosynthesis